jgi:N-acyl-D-glutamate deacylase
MEKFAPVFRQKGRLRKGFDADLTLFDPTEIMGMASYQEPLSPSKGIQYVLVNGEFVLKGGQFIEDTMPGRLIKAPGGKAR